MKKLSLLFVSVILSLTLFTIDACGQQREPFITRTFSASTIQTVETNTSGGSITVEGNANAQAVVEVYVSRDNWSTERIKEAFEKNYTVDIKVENGKLLVEAKQKNTITNWNRDGLNISFKISVPKEVNTRLNTSGGSIRISDLSGSLDFKTSGGSLNVANVSGTVTGATSGGSITVSNANDNINLKTSGGSITANDCNGIIYLRTSGGSLKMSNLSGNIDASTSGGSVTANRIKGTLKTGTSGGSVRLEGISGNVDAHTSGGSLNVEMDSVEDYIKLANSGNLNLTLPAGNGYTLNVRANKIETSGLSDFSGNLSNTEINGRVGNGGAEINIRTTQRANLSFK